MVTIEHRVDASFQAFDDRNEAGLRLARLIGATSSPDARVMAIPRGGVPVGRVLAHAFAAPLDLVFVRKLPIPWSSQAGFGAIALDGAVVLNRPYVRQLGLAPDEIDRVAEEVRAELERRAREYRMCDLGSIRDCDVYLVDDGLATGYTTVAAAKMIRARNPRSLTLAVPVSPADSIELVRSHFDHVYCLICQARPPFAVASFYRRFPDLTDDQVRTIIDSTVQPETGN